MLYLVSLDCPDVRFYDAHAQRELRMAKFLSKSLPMDSMQTVWSLGGEHVKKIVTEMGLGEKQSLTIDVPENSRVEDKVGELVKVSRNQANVAILPPVHISSYLGEKSAQTARILAPCGGVYQIGCQGSNIFAALHRLNPQTKQWDTGYYTKTDVHALEMLK